MLSTINGQTVLDMTVTLPRVGVWCVDYSVDTLDPTTVNGAIAIVLGDSSPLNLAGTTLRADVWRGRVRGRAFAGANKLGTIMPPKSYASVTSQRLFSDLLTAAGEKLSTTSSLSGNSPMVALEAITAGASINLFTDWLGYTWRSLLDGTVWIGNETWPEITPPQFDLLDYDPEDKRQTWGVTSPWAIPGTVVNGMNIDRVVHHVRSDAIRTEVWFQ